MIKKLVLKNFQSWKYLEVDFSRVNIILGETNSGKSAILRALGALFYNNLEGDGFIHAGTSLSGAEIQVHTNDNIVALIKGNGANRYVLNDKVFDKIGRAVPSEIKEALQIEEIIFDEDTSLKLQFQSQLEAPFLLSDQGVRATRLLGTVSKVATIYQAARIASQQKKNQIAKVAALSQIELRAQERVKSFDYLTSLEPLVNQVRLLKTQVLAKQEAAEALGCAYDTIKQAKLRVLSLSSEAYILSRVCHTLNRVCNVCTKQNELTKCLFFLASFRQKESALRLSISRVEATVRRHQRLEEVAREKGVTSSFLELLTTKEQFQLRIKRAETELKESVDELKVLEELYLCPACGQEKK